VDVSEVHLHEVGALDSIADIVGSVAALHALAIDRLVCGPISLGGGSVAAAHGRLPIPGPAVLELLGGSAAAARGGPIEVELATPTGVALAVTLADEFGPMPQVARVRVGVGAGSRDPDGHVNVLRLVLGPEVDSGPAALVIEANVDDLDPRVWPGVLDALLVAGAADAWLTQILMKKGRPAHTLHVLAPIALVDELEAVMFATTTTIGVRRTQVERTILDRRVDSVDVAGQPIRVKLALRDGLIANVMPEYDDVVAAAAALNLPEREILELAMAAAKHCASRR
jgi:pyridinium-3,5-bisthiocarboxylic acid mononucleotide nickel chelatase